MQTTEYFRTDVLVKRPYLKAEWLTAALANPLKREIQREDGRIRSGYGSKSSAST